MWKRCSAPAAAVTDRIEHMAMRPSRQMGMMATYLFPTTSAGLYIPRRELRFADRAFYAGAENFHCSILLQGHDPKVAHLSLAKWTITW